MHVLVLLLYPLRGGHQTWPRVGQNPPIPGGLRVVPWAVTVPYRTIRYLPRSVSQFFASLRCRTHTCRHDAMSRLVLVSGIFDDSLWCLCYVIFLRSLPHKKDGITASHVLRIDPFSSLPSQENLLLRIVSAVAA